MINKRFTVQELNKFDLMGRLDNLSATKQTLLAGGLAGAAVTAVDDDADTLGTTAVNVGLGAGAAFSVKMLVEHIEAKSAESLVKQEEKKSNEANKKKAEKDAKANARTVTRTDNRLTVSRLQAKEIQGHYAPKVQARKTSRKMQNWYGAFKVGSAVGLGAFALASVMDTSEGLAEDTRTSRMVADQEKNLARKQTKEKRQQDKLGYGHVDMGQMAIDLFNERTGHHKMGSAKFQ